AIDLSQQRSADYIAPGTPLQADMADILSDLLGVPTSLIGIQRNFFELGANSALLSEFVVRLNARRVHRVIGIADIYLHHNIRELAAALSAEVGTPGTAQQRSVSRAQARRQAVLKQS